MTLSFTNPDGTGHLICFVDGVPMYGRAHASITITVAVPAACTPITGRVATAEATLSRRVNPTRPFPLGRHKR